MSPAAGRPPAGAPITTVVFDLGGVLIDWDPRHLYRQLLATDEDVDRFLDEVGFVAWNHGVDAGASTWAEAVEALAADHPHHRELIAAYPARFAETLVGPIDGSVEVLHELAAQGTRLLALTNWSAETFPVARDRFDFLHVFDAIVVSGEEGVAKPDAAVFGVLVDRHGLDPGATVFVDDRPANIDAAQDIGMVGVLFTSPQQLRADLEAVGALRLT